MFKEILVPIDLNDEHSWALSLPAAVGLCQSEGATLHVMTVVPDFGSAMVSQYFPADYEEKMRQGAHDKLEEITARNVPEGVNVQRIVAEGKIYQNVIEMGKEIGADLIVMGSHHPEFSDYLLGSNASRVVQHAHCSVMVVRD